MIDFITLLQEELDGEIDIDAPIKILDEEYSGRNEVSQRAGRDPPASGPDHPDDPPVAYPHRTVTVLVLDRQHVT